MSTNDAIVVSLQFESDYSQIIEDAKSFKQEMQNTVGYAEKVSEALSFLQSDDMKAQYETLIGNNFEALETVKTMLHDIKTEYGEIQEGFEKGFIDDNFVSSSVDKLKGLQMAVKSIGSEVKSVLQGRGTTESLTDILMSARNADTARKELNMVRGMYGKGSTDSLGVSQSELRTLFKAQGFLDREIRSFNAKSGGTQSLDALTGLMMQNKIYQESVNAATGGRQLSQDQAENLARLMVTRSKNYTTNFGVQSAKRLGLQDIASPNFVIETLPQGLRKAYQTYGNVGATKITQHSDSQTAADADAVKAFRDLVYNGNRVAIKAGIDSGMLRMDNGQISFGNVSKAHWNKLAGKTAQIISDSKSGLPYLWADPNDPNEQERELRRLSKTYQEAEELAKVVERQKGYIADAGIDSKYTGFTDAGVARAKLRKGWYPDQFIVPQTRIDKDTGKLVFSDPKQQIDFSGRTIFERKDTDPWVTMGSNTITQFLGLKGNNTYGYGRNDDGTPRYLAPIFAKLNMSQAYGENEDREYVVKNPELNKRHINIANRNERPVYGDSDYVYAWGDADNAVLMHGGVYDLVFGTDKLPKKNSKEYGELRTRLGKSLGYTDENIGDFNEMFADWYGKGSHLRSKGLSKIMDNMFVGNALAESAKDQNKAIEAGRKKATPGFSFNELGFSESPKMALVDFGAMYDLFGVDKADSFMRLQKRIDGVSYLDPRFAPSGYGFQSRAGFGGMKFFAQPEDWRYELNQGGILDAAYKTGKFRYLFDKKDNSEAHQAALEARDKARDEYERLVAESTSLDISKKATGPDREQDLEKRTELNRRQIKRARQAYRNAEKQLLDTPENLYDFWMFQGGLEDEEKNEVIDKLEKLQGRIDSPNTTEKARERAIAERNAIRSQYMNRITDKDIGLLVSADTDVKYASQYRQMEEEDFYKMFGKKASPTKWTTKDGKRVALLNASQQNALAQEVNDLVGLEVNRLSPDFQGVKDYIPASLAVSLGPNRDLRELSDKNYAQAIAALDTDQGKMEFLKNLPQGRRLLGQLGMSWQNSSEVQRLVKNQQQKLRDDQNEGHLLVPEVMGMGASGVNPGSTWMTMFGGQLMGIKPEDLKDSNIRQMLIESVNEDNIIAASRKFRNWTNLGTTRMPAGPGENLADLNNVGSSKRMRNMLRAVGADENLVYLTPSQQYKMNSGDFDGDTTWLFEDPTESGQMFLQMKYIQEQMNRARTKLREAGYDKANSTQGTPASSVGEALVAFQLNHRNAQNEMALFSGGIRNAMLGWTDDDDKWLSIAMNIDAYDKATSERMKQGLKTNVSGVGMKAAKEGAAFQRLIKQLGEISRGTEGVTPNLFGAKIPSINDDDNIGVISSVFKASRNGELPNEFLESELKAWTSKNYDDNTARGQAAKVYAGILSNYFTGRKVFDQKDEVEMLSAIADWQTSIDSRRAAGYTDEQLGTEAHELSQLRSRYKFIKNNGLTSKNISERLGNIDTDLAKYRAYRQQFDETGMLSKEAFQEAFGAEREKPAEIDKETGLYKLTDRQKGLYSLYSDAKIESRETLQNTYRSLLERQDPFVAYLDSVKDSLDDEQKQAIDELKKQRVESPNGETPLMPTTIGDLNKLMNTETVTKRVKFNWSDVTPWMYKAMQKSDFGGLAGIQVENLRTGEKTTLDKKGFDPYPYNRSKEGQQALIEARELDQKGLFVPGYESTPSTYGGTLRHKAFELYFKSKFMNPDRFDIGNLDNTGLTTQDMFGPDKMTSPEDFLYNMLLGSSAQKQLSEFGIGVKRGEDGQIQYDFAEAVHPQAQDFVNSITAALGTFENGKYKGGTLSAFTKAIEKEMFGGHERVVNIEGLNIDENGNPINATSLQGRGTRFVWKNGRPALSENDTDLDVQGTFAPDLITRNTKTGKYTMYDYKTSVEGAIDSLYQQYVYIDDIFQNAKDDFIEELKGDNSTGNKTGGWSQYLTKEAKDRIRKEYETNNGNVNWDKVFIDQDGKSINPLNFAALKATDTNTGQMFTLAYNDEDRKAIASFYGLGQKMKMEDAMNGYTMGIDYIQKLLIDKYGKGYEKRAGGSVQSALAYSGGESSTIDFVSTQFAKDQETISEISSKLYREKLKQEKISGGGYNRFDSMRRELGQTLSPELSEKITASLKAKNDVIGLELFTEEQQRKEEAMRALESVERTAAVEDWDSVRSSMRSRLFGVQGNQALGGIFDTVAQMNSVRKIRESWKNNPDLWDAKSGQWTAKAQEREKDYKGNYIPGTSYAERYAQAEEADRKMVEEFRESLPTLTDASIRSTNNTLAKLTAETAKQSPEQALQDAYQQRVDNISKFIKEQDATINDAIEKLSQKTGEGENAQNTLQGPEREAVEAILENAKSSRQAAVLALKNGSAYKYVDETEQKRLGLVRETPEERSKRWLEERNAVLLSMARREEESYLDENGYIKDIRNMDKYRAARKRRMSIEKGKTELRPYASEMAQDGKYQDELQDKRFESYYTGKKDLTKEERVEAEFRRRRSEIRNNKTPKEYQDWKASHSDDDLRRQIDNELTAQDQLTKDSIAAQVDNIWRNELMQENHQDYALRQFNRQHSLLGRSRSRAYQSYARRTSEREALQLTQSDLGFKIAGEEATLKNLEAKYQNATSQEKDLLTPKIEASKAKLAGFNKELETTQQKLSTIGGSGKNAAAAVFDSISQSVTMLAARFGRQMFYKAINEVKSFVKEYDKSMTEIQMITLKSDEDITKLGQKLIGVAKNTGSTVTEVTSAASNLYRQGLSDEEVDKRLDDVIKFSKVTGIKTTEASKIITTALQNGLVNNSEEAMDALTALGDSAATTASEIAKGMQKSAAAAKQSGMSYGELVTLLTIGTSKTQLGGSTIGSSLNTLMYRLYKVNNGEDFTDENGRHIAATAASKALDKIGVSLWDKEGNFRGPYQVLQDIAANWETADDTTQSMILTTLGAGRQRSNIATLLQGMAEDNGELAQKYLDTAEGSRGITNEKYEAYLESLDAKLKGVKTSFDGLIESLNVSGSAGNFLNFITDVTSGLTKAEQASKTFSKALTVIGATIAGVLIFSNPLLALTGGITAAALLGASAYGKNVAEDTTEEDYKKYQQQNKEIEDKTKTTEEKVKQTRELIEKAFTSEGISATEKTELKSNLEELSKSFGDVNINIESLINNYDQLMNKMDDYDEKIKKDKSDNLKSWIDTEVKYGKHAADEESVESIVSSGRVKEYAAKKLSERIKPSTNIVIPDGMFTDLYEKESWMGEFGAGKAGRDYGDTTYTHDLAWLGPLAEELYKQGKIKFPENLSDLSSYISSTDNPARTFRNLIAKATKESGFTVEQRAQGQRLLNDVLTNLDESSVEDIDLNNESLDATAETFASKVGSTMQLSSSYQDAIKEAYINRVKNNPKYGTDLESAIKEELDNFVASTYLNNELNEFRLEDYVENSIDDEMFARIANKTRGDQIEELVNRQIEKEQSELTPTMTKAYYDQNGNRISTDDVMRSLEDYAFQYANTKEAAEAFNRLFYNPETDSYDKYYKTYGTENLPEWFDNWITHGQEASSPIYGIQKNGRSYITQDAEDYEIAKNEALESLGYITGLIFDIAEGFSAEYPDAEFVPSDVMQNLINEYIDGRKNALKHDVKFLKKNGISLSEKDYESAEEKEEAEEAPRSKFQEAIETGLSNYEINNEKTVQADRMLSAINDNNIENFSDFVNLVNNDTIKDFEALLTAFPELAKILDGIVKKNPDTGEFELEEGLKGSEEDSLLIDVLKEFIGQRSSDQHVYETDAETYEKAMQFFKGGVADTDQLYENAYKSIVGDALTGKRYLYNQAVSNENAEDMQRYAFTPLEQRYEQMMLDNYNNGIIGIADYQKATMQRKMYEAALNGTYGEEFGYDTNRNVMSAFTSDNSQLESMIRLSEVINDFNVEQGTNFNLQDYINQVENGAGATQELVNYVDDAYTSFDNLQEGINEVSETIKGAERNTKNFSKEFKSNTKYMDLFSSDSKKANSALLQVNQTMAKVAQNQFYREQYKQGKRDKKTMQGVAGLLGFGDEKNLKGINEETIKGLLASTEEIDTASIQEIADSYAEEITSLINEQFKNGEGLVVDGIPITVEDGPVNIDASGSIAAAEAGLAALIDQVNALFEGWKMNAHLVVESSGTEFRAKIVTDGLGKGLGGGGGGGGGGGKSEADKLIEKQKREMQILEHQQKLLEIYEKGFDFKNDYSDWTNNLEGQISLLHQMQEAYRANIDELSAMMAKTKDTEDDYYKLRDALYSAEEALKDVNNQINEINAKRIEIKADKLEEADKPGTHLQNMLQSYADRAMNQDRFEDYVNYTEELITSKKEQRAQNDAEIEGWKEELTQYEADSDSWREVRDKIYEVEEENAELDNELVQTQLDLYSQRLSQISKVLQQDTQSAAHNQTIAETYGSSYESGGYRKQYEDMIREQTAATKIIIEENKKAEQSAKEQMDALDENTTAWFEAQAAVFQYQEAVAQAEVTLSELNRALAQSEIDKINEDYEDQTRELLHVNELLSEQAQEYLDLKDTSAYIEAMQMVTTNLGDAIEESAKKVDRLNETYKKGMANGSLDPAMQRELLDQINEAESEYQRFLLDRSKKQREINKAALDDLFEDQDWAASEYDHNIKLLGYQNSIYQNNGELTNVNATIKEENILRSKRVLALQDELTNLKRQKALFEDDQEQEKRIVEQIKKHEEAIEQENAQIKKNNKLLEENEKKIMQVRKTLEDAVDKEIEAEKKRQREILSANVSMQDTIVNLLKKRLQDEWDLKKKDIEKEKESLAEYKSLINERYNYRKKASQQADKDEELAEYRRQLALIEADPSRTKDAKELRRKIEDLEKEQAWTIAEDEVAAESERVDDQMKGMDKFVQYNDELLNEILSDANNFATEMNNILSGSFEESYNKIIEFMSKENEAFMKSLPDAQKQMIQSWEDTWKKANDIVDSNYALITETIADKDTFLEFMRSSDRDYRSYLESGDKNSMNLLERQWSEQYDNYVNSIKTGAEFDLHGHELTPVESKIDELKDNIFKVNTVDITGKPIDPYGLGEKSGVTTDFSNEEELNLTDLSDLHYVAPPPAEETPNVPQTDTGSGNGNPGSKKTYTGVVIGQSVGTKTKEYSTEKEALEAINEQLAKEDVHGAVAMPVVVTSQEEADKIIEMNNKVNEESKRKTNNNSSSIDLNLDFSGFNSAVDNFKQTYKDTFGEEQYKKVFGPNLNGGLIDYTGLAWVDGTMQRPESFLDATDTKLLRSMLDAFNYVKISPQMSYIDPSMYNNNTSVGDINVTINQAELKDDADYAEVAKRVGEEFNKQIKRGGMNLSGYAFS